MNSEFIDILKKLTAEQGKEALLNNAKCKAFLADYTRGEYKKESRLLLQALDAGVQKAIDTTGELEVCKRQQIRVLHEEHFVTAEAAEDIVETLVLVLRGEQENGTSENAVCKNCGKELQKEWKSCPYCTTVVAAAANTSRIISSAVSSGSGSWGYGIGQIKPAAPVCSNTSQTQQPEASTTIILQGMGSLWVYEPGYVKKNWLLEAGEQICKFVLTNDSINFVPNGLLSSLNSFSEKDSKFIPLSTIKEIKKTKYGPFRLPAIEFTCYDQYSYFFTGYGAVKKAYDKICELCGLNEYKGNRP